MALMYNDASITPTKRELLDAWIPSQPWAEGIGPVKPFGSYRFDDPDGEVGLEAMLLRSPDGGVVLHVPLSYRAAPLDGAEAHLITTMEHTVLGKRWIYDATADPVWTATLATAILTGGTQAELVVESDGQQTIFEPKVTVVGSGAPGTTVPSLDELEVEVVHRVGEQLAGDHALTGTWPDGGGLLAVVRFVAPR
jgi:hypothetical protein